MSKRNFLSFNPLLISEVFVIKEARGKGVRERESYKRGFYPSLGYDERHQVANFIKRLDWGGIPPL